MALNENNLSMKDVAEKNYQLFADVSNKYMNTRSVDDVIYDMLDYPKILDIMVEFVGGYTKYTESEDNKYENKVLPTAKFFYDTLFEDKKYRTKLTLHDFSDLNKTYLKKTKEMKDTMTEYLRNEKFKDNKEFQELLTLTNNQYRKLSKVYVDDMKLYRWLSTSKSSVFKAKITDDLKTKFYDKTTPVLHKSKRGE